MPLTEAQASRRQTLIGSGIGLAAAALMTVALIAGAFEAFDHRLLDWRFRIRGERDASKSVVLVPIDDATIRAYGGWPIPRDQYAVLLTALHEAGARSIGVDIQFPADVNQDPRGNAILSYVSHEDSTIVHAVSFISDASVTTGPATAPRALDALRKNGVTAFGVDLPVAESAILPYEELLNGTAAVGHITVITDRDGAVRRQPLLIRFDDRVYPALGLRLVGAGVGRVAPPSVRRVGGRLRVGWTEGPEWTIPLDRDGATSLDFAGDRDAFSNTISMIEVLQAYRAGDMAGLRERVAGRYALVGLDSRTEVSEDVGTTPFAATTPLLFVHANVVENLAHHRFLTGPRQGQHAVVLAVIGGVLGWLFASLPLAAAAAAAGGAVMAAAIVNFALFALWGVNVPPFASLLLAPIVYAGVASARLIFVESRSKAREADLREGRSVEQQFLPEALVGKDLSRYRIVEKLGRGAMGVVYRASDPRLERDVAIKVLPGRSLADERSRKRFRREALALSKLNHPHIAGIIDFDSQDGTDFLVMECVHGTALTDQVRRGPLPESEVIRIAGEVAEALAEAHGRGVVHRDLKPENILLTSRGEVKVLDFGLALFFEEDAAAVTRSQNLTEAGHMVGTLPYMAPEVLRGGGATPRSDLYSLGVVTFEMATGRRPFPDYEAHELLFTILDQEPPPPRILNGRISRQLEALILRLLAKPPADRFASAGELLESLRALGSATGMNAAGSRLNP